MWDAQKVEMIEEYSKHMRHPHNRAKNHSQEANRGYRIIKQKLEGTLQTRGYELCFLLGSHALFTLHK
jgi:hypothetical protein